MQQPGVASMPHGANSGGMQNARAVEKWLPLPKLQKMHWTVGGKMVVQGETWCRSRSCHNESSLEQALEKARQLSWSLTVQQLSYTAWPGKLQALAHPQAQEHAAWTEPCKHTDVELPNILEAQFLSQNFQMTYIEKNDCKIMPVLLEFRLKAFF